MPVQNEPLMPPITEAASAVLGKITVSTAVGVGAVGALTLSDVAIICGIVLGVASFLLDWYYKRVNARTLRDAQVRRRGSRSGGD